MSACRLALLVWAGWFALSLPVAARLLGDRQQVECGNLVEGDMADSSVVINCFAQGITFEQLHDFMQLAQSPSPADQQALRDRLDALLSASSQVEAIRSSGKVRAVRRPRRSSAAGDKRQ